MSGALRQIFAEFGIAWEGSALERGAHQVEGVAGQVKDFAAVLAGSQVLGAIKGFADAFEEEAGRLEDNARALDLTTDSLQELRFAASQAGVDVGAADAALARFQQSVAGAARGSKAQADAFRALGVNVRDANGNVGELGDLMDGVASGLGAVQDPTRRAQLAVQLFGREGARLATIMHDGEGGLAALRAEVAELGGGVLPEAIEAAGAYGDAMDRQRVASQALRSVIAVQLLPALTWLTTAGTKAAAWLVRMTRDTNTLRVVMIALGAAGALAGARFLSTWGPTLLRFGKMAAVVALLALAVDDLVTLFEGGDSAIGRLLDSLGGLGTQQRFVTELKLAWEGVTAVVHDVGAALADFSVQAGSALDALGARWTAWTTGARASVDAMVTAILDALRSVGVPIDAIAGRVERLLGAVRSATGRALDAVTTQPGDAASAGTFMRDLVNPRAWAEEWRGVFGGGGGGAVRAAAPPVVSPRVPGPASVTHQRNVTISPGAVNVTGVADPEAAARHAVRLITERERAAHDAAHPLSGAEE